MQQLRLPQRRVPLIPHGHKLLPCSSVFEVLVALFVLPHGHPGAWSLSTFGRIIMARPELDVIRQGEELTPGVEQVCRTTAGEVAACSADVCLEDRVATEYVV